MSERYDIVILGGGPAGLTAALYACRGGMKTVVLEKTALGGQVLITDKIENFPGFPQGVKGPELAEMIAKQAVNFGIEVKPAEVKKISVLREDMGGFLAELSDDGKVEAISIIVATGARWNELGIPGEKKLAGRGVSYCAVCDGPLFKGRDVVVIGGGDTALEDALFLAKFAKKVTIVHRRDRLRAAKILQDRALAEKKIEFCFNSIASKIKGETRCEAIEIKDVSTGACRDLKAEGAFVLIGTTPNSDVVRDLVELDDKGCVICSDDMATSMEGIFACGDVRKKTLRQVITAAGDGATAAFSAQHYVERVKGIEYK